ncbi:MAG TPA: tetratricopeptide repeat protein [Bacteroidia bacterium]|nr:tetratricopeptide repeat protein [Bacteroidia bacterium]
MKFAKYIFLLFISLQLCAQKTDSVQHLLKTDKEDTTKLKHLIYLCWTFRSIGSYDTALIYGKQSLTLANKLGYKRGLGKAYSTIGNVYHDLSNYPLALDYYLKALKLYQDVGYQNGIGSSYTNIGLVYYYQANYPKALEFYLKDLKIRTDCNDKVGMATCYGNIGLVYTDQSDYTKALDYYLKALQINQTIDEKKGIADCYLNIGIVYHYQSHYKEALNYYLKSLKMNQDLSDKQGAGTCYTNIGNVYSDTHDYTKALEYYLKDLQLKESIGDQQGAAVCYSNMGGLYFDTKDFKNAIQYSSKCLQISKQIGYTEGQRIAYENLARAYGKTNNYNEAYQCEVAFKQLTDSIFNADNSKQLGDMKTKFEVEKKEGELKLKSEAAELINNQEKKQQQFIIYAVVFVLVIVFVFSGFLFRRFKITQKQKHIIQLQKDEVSRQKHLVEEHQKEIIDSITYAKRLQQAILPADAEIKKHLPNNFIYYQPKDIVAGDFYWMEHLDGITFIAAADSTGHGVPGAMVSIVCSNSLNRAVKEFGLRDTGKILDKTRELVLETFEKSGEQIKDGMDISLLAINKSKQQINWSGANNQLWYISNNKLIEVKADKQPIGKTDNPTPFTTHHIALNPNDIFYLMTDGYADQFGGTKGKKFKYKQLEDLVIANSDKSLDEQKQILTTTFNTWKTNLEQVDDVTIIGIKM